VASAVVSAADSAAEKAGEVESAGTEGSLETPAVVAAPEVPEAESLETAGIR
jgi:hypothetical protein